MRMRSRWYRQEKPRSLEETAGALAFISWQIASERVRNMEAGKFYIDLPERTLAVIAEYLIFTSHLMDRLAYSQLGPDERMTLVSTLANRQADIYEDNRRDAGDQNSSRSQFIDLLNQRYMEYSDYPFDNQQPSYSLLRHLAQNICAVMGKEFERNVTEQVIEIEAPACLELTLKAMKNLLPDVDSPVPE